MGIGDAKEHKNWLTSGVEELTTIAGQKAVVTNSKKAISNFKIREGDPVGIRVTLRSDKMYEFFDRFISVASPRIRDFRGLSAKGFDGRGNYNFGVNEQIIFPEIDYDKINNIKGMNISIVTTGKTDEEAYELLIAMGLPIRQKKKKLETATEDPPEEISVKVGIEEVTAGEESIAENTLEEMQDEDKADEKPIDEVETASDVEENKEETSERWKKLLKKYQLKVGIEEVTAGEESVAENTLEEMQDEDKADEKPIDEVETASDVEDNKEESSEEKEETPEEGETEA